MNKQVETRLREALGEAAGTVDPATLRPLIAPHTSGVRSRLRPPMLVAVAAAVAGTVVAGTVMLARPATHPTPDLSAADSMASMALVAQMGSTTADISVFLCHRGSPSRQCKGDNPSGTDGRAATEPQIDAVRRMLHARPEVESVRFEDQRAALANFQQAYQNNKALLAAVRLEDMPESFRVDLKDGADPRPVVQAARAMPGVASVVDQQCVNRLNEQADQAKRTGAAPPTMPC